MHLKLKLCLLFLAALLDNLEASLSDVETGYWKVDTNKGYLYKGSSALYMKKAKLQCALLCLKTKYCTGFSHVKNIRFCYIFVHRDADRHNNGELFKGLLHYRKRIVDCPVTDGYTLSADEEFCFKIYTTSATFSDAGNRCQRDGGHLALMDSNFKKDFFVRTFQQLKRAPGEYFVGAWNIEVNGKRGYRWINGRSVHTTMFDPGDQFPVSAKCIILRSYNNYLGVANCEVPSMFICEVT